MLKPIYILSDIDLRRFYGAYLIPQIGGQGFFSVHASKQQEFETLVNLWIHVDEIFFAKQPMCVWVSIPSKHQIGEGHYKIRPYIVSKLNLF